MSVGPRAAARAMVPRVVRRGGLALAVLAGLLWTLATPAQAEPDQPAASEFAASELASHVVASPGLGPSEPPVERMEPRHRAAGGGERLVVHFEEGHRGPGPSERAREAVERAAVELDLAAHRAMPQVGAVVYETGGDEDAAVAAARLDAQPGVDAVERDAPVTITERVPDDAYWGQQWGQRRIGSPAAWATTTGSPDVTIAVLDTGVEAGHPDLAGKVPVAGGGNFTAEGSADDTSDRNGHGTSAAGVAAAITDNAAGIAGGCWDCEILPVKVMDANGAGSGADVASGIVYAADEGADVINLSVGSRQDLRVLREAVRYAHRRDVVLVASAGNFGSADGSRGEDPVYPAAYDEVLSVAGSDEQDDRYEWSSFGGWVDVAAPGCNPATDLVTSSQPYRWFCGTSSAAPLTAGGLALARSADPGATNDEIVDAVVSTSEDADYVTAGRVDIQAALGALDVTEPDAEPDPDQPVPPPGPGLDPAPDPGQEPDEPTDDVETEPGLELRRVAGANRFDTAARLSVDTFDPGVDRVYLATGQTYADALGAGVSAGAIDAPVLLTRPASLPEETAIELERLAPEEVVVAGGTTAVSSTVEGAAGDAAGAPTRRLDGRDRYATAAALTTDSFDDAVETVYIATGHGFADALAGVPAAVAEGGALLLTAPRSLPDPTREALHQLQPERIVVLGGGSAVTDAVTEALGDHADQVVRVAGADRYKTAARIAERAFPERADAAYLATGTDFPDALAGGAAAGRQGAPMLLVTRDRLPDATAEALRRLRPGVNVTLGGSKVVSDGTEAAAGRASAAER